METDKHTVEDRIPTYCCGLSVTTVAKLYIALMLVLCILYLAMGSYAVAPFWIFDGAAFSLSAACGILTLHTVSPMGAAALTCMLCAVACVDICFFVAGIIYAGDVINPYAPNVYGSRGNNFIVCSISSCLVNLFAALVFYRIAVLWYNSRTEGKASKSELPTIASQ